MELIVVEAFLFLILTALMSKKYTVVKMGSSGMLPEKMQEMFEKSKK